MVEIQSKEAIDKISDELKVQPSIEIGRKLSDSIQPVFEVSAVPQVRSEEQAFADSTGGTIFTTHATKKTFLVGISLTVSKDAVNNGILSTVQGFMLGTGAKNLLLTNYEPLTAGSFTHTMMFPIPVQMEFGSIISLVNGAALASIDTNVILYLYETDPQ